MMEECEEEQKQLEPDDLIAQFGGFDDTAIGEAEEEGGALGEGDGLGNRD
jgi:hypothetical protein